MSILIRRLLMPLARSFLGGRYYMPLREAYRCYRQSAALYADPQWRVNVKRLEKYANRHNGERCFIIGNGPSLNNTDLSLLKDEITFGLNRIYLLFEELGFATSYYVAVNRLVIEQCAQEIGSLRGLKFISWHARDMIDCTADTMFLHCYARIDPMFCTDITKGVWGGTTVTYTAIQIAYYLGFEKVILIGVDHAFSTRGKPHTVVVSEGDDPNHFDPAYFGRGFRWQLPDLETSELAYRIAKYYFNKANREIVDATVGGKLQVFPKVDYRKLFA